MQILLANDDGQCSPLLETLIGLLAASADLTVVVPKQEQSWRGKAMTRFGLLAHERARMGGHDVHVVDGTPADCVNVALYHLCKKKPDLVISGPNVGSNTGISFILSSGTVGACVEANIAGIPALAVSQKLHSAEFDRYRESGVLDAKALEHSVRRVKRFFPPTFRLFREHPQLLRPDLTWNVNFPDWESDSPAFKLCQVGRVIYDSCFGACEGGFSHDLRVVHPDPEAEGDGEALEKGFISISPLSFMALGKVAPDLRQEAEGAFHKVSL